MECRLCSTILVLLLGLVAFAYYYVRKRYAYFKDRAIIYDKPIFPFGSLKGVGTKIHSSAMFRNIYDKFVGKDVMCGMYFFIEPLYMILEPELAKNILVKDFNYFHDRGMYHNEADDPLSANLFALEGQKWKNLRAKLSPTFTSGKMKMMFDTVLQCAEQLENYLEPIAIKNEMIEIKDVLGRFSTDVIGNCAFGIDCNTLKNQDSEFRYYGRKVFDPPPMRQLIILFAASFPNLSRRLGIVVTQKSVSKFFMRIVEETLQFRKSNPVVRKDFMKLLMELESEDGLSSVDKLNFNEIAAQCFLFFLAGFETSSSTMSFCLLELAKNPDIQDKVRADIEKITKKYDGKVTYESILEMDYLDNTINETLRKFPPVDALARSATEDYKVPDTNYTIEKGRFVIIPTYGMHMNPDIYPNPEIFNPDRFLPENKINRHPFTFLPFGEGPHNCIGMRFGLLQTRLGLVHVLRKYKVAVCEKTSIDLEFAKNSPVMTLKHGTWVQLQKL